MWGSGAPRGWPAPGLEIGAPVIGGTNNCVLYIDSSGNAACDAPFVYNGADVLSVGKATFENWSAGYAVLQIGGNSALRADIAEGAAKSFRIMQNAYHDGNWKYVSAAPASLYYQYQGTHVFQIAAAGVADAVISFTQSVYIPVFTGGGLSIGKTTWESWGNSYSVLQVGGTGSFMSSKTEGANRTMDVSQNTYFDGGNWKYISADEASQHEQYAGTHTFRMSAAGAADANITWNKAVHFSNLMGICILLTNKTGANSVKGRAVKPDTANNDSVVYTAIGDQEIIGVFLDDGVADGSQAFIVIAGIADVAMEDNTAATRGNWVQTSDNEAGYCDATNAAPPGGGVVQIDTHMQETGHCIETVAAGGAGTHILARCVIHFN